MEVLQDDKNMKEENLIVDKATLWMKRRRGLQLKMYNWI